MRDEIYADQHGEVKDFTFDKSVVEVFPDMIQRSVPGYSTIISTIGKLTEKHHQANTNLYDLGCSLGAATLSMRKSVSKDGCHVFGVDNSSAMVDKCRLHIKAYKSEVPVTIDLADVTEYPITNASVVVMNFTLQFIPPEQRLSILKKIYDGLVPGGLLILSEKLRWEDDTIQDVIDELHLDFKRANGYSELEISQKRSAIENVMKIDSERSHIERLQQAGFNSASIWFQCFNFSSFVAVKQK
jgi:tRNA (cmo5U34)-methyltransferase